MSRTESTEDDEYDSSHIAQPVYGAWGTVYPSACAEYPPNNVIDATIVNDISVIDEVLLEALEEFNDDCLFECDALAPEVVAMPIVVTPQPIVAFAVPEGFIPNESEKLIKSEYVFDELMDECCFDDDFQYKLKLISCSMEDVTSNKLMDYLKSSNNEKKGNRSVSALRWKEKREKKRQQLKDGVKPVAVTTARQVAAAKRVRENGKFKKLSTKWIPVTDFRALTS